MALTTAQAALQVNGAKALVLILVEPRDPANGDATVQVGISSANFITADADAPANFPFHGFLAEGSGVRFAEFLIRSGASPVREGGSEIARGSLTIDVTDEQAGWRDLDWNGAAFTVYVGARHRADGQLMVFSEFDELITGLVERMDAKGDRQWEMSFADPRAALEEPATVKFYRGFGGGFQVEPTVILFSDGPGTALDAPFTLEIIGRMRSLPPALNQGTILQIGTQPKIRVWVESDGTLWAGFTDSLGSTTNYEAPHTLTEGDPFYLAVTVNAGGTDAKVYAGADADDTLPVLSGLDVSAEIVGLLLEDVQLGSANIVYEAWEGRLWSVEKTQAELEDLGDGPVTDAADQADLIESWRFAEGAVIGTGPEIVFGEKSLIDFAPLVGGGTPVWVSSYEGDDPDQFPGSPAGQTKARTWGPAKNVKLVQVDSQRPAYTWDHAIPSLSPPLDPYRYVLRLRAAGVPMVREHSVTAVTGSDFDFVAPNIIRKVMGQLALHFTFAAFIPGQKDPARLGQRIVVSGTALNDGTFRVAELSDDGLEIKTSEQTVVNEDAPAGTVIASHPSDVQWEGFEQGQLSDNVPRVELPSAPGADLTADMESVFGGQFSYGLWSAMHAEISGRNVDTAAVSFNPVFGYHLPAGDAKTKKAVLDELARSAFGWWIERPDGDHDLGTWLPPSGSPVAALTPARISEVEPLATILPRGKFEIAHTPIWFQQSGDALAGSVSAGDRKRWSEPFTIRPVVDRRIRDARFPLSSEIPRLTTFLSAASEISTYEGLARPFHFKEARWYRLRFDSLWPLFIRRNDCVTVTWDDEDLELDATLCRVTGREIDAAASTMELEVFALKEEPT